MNIALALFALPAGLLAAEAVALRTPPELGSVLLAAARAGEAREIDRLVEGSYQKRGSLEEGAVKELLDGLARGGETRAFALFLERISQTNYGKNWQPDDALLGEVVRAGRRELLEIMLANWLDPARLEARGEGDAEMRAWIAKRVAEERQRRADVDALVAASGKGDLETMRRLLDAGVNVNGITSQESRHTPLTLAAAKSQLEAVRLLLERGAAVDQPKFPGWDYTPLCLTKSVPIAELLKSYGANVQAKLFHRDVSILTYIARWGGAEMVAWMLAQGLDPKMLNDHRQNLLFEAGNGPTAEILLKAGVDPNAVDAAGRTPLSCAQKGVAEKLLAAGAKLPPRGIAEMIGSFASADSIEAVIKATGVLDLAAAQKGVITAAHNDQEKLVEMLLAHGAKANEPGQWGNGDDHPMLPLMVCTVFGSAKTAKILLAHGADPNAGDWPGILLQNAIENNHLPVAKLLWEAGGKGVSELAYRIAMKEEKKVGELLQSAPAFADQPEFWAKAFPAAARTGQLQIVRTALAKGVPLKETTAPAVTRGSDDEDAVYAAASEGQHETLAELLAYRKKSGDRTDLRQPLWAAVWNSHPYEAQRPAEDFERCVKLLLDAGAAVADVERNGPLVTNAVFTRNPGGNPKVIDLLVAAGADPNPTFPGEPGKSRRLTDLIESACTEQGCSTPFARTVAAVEKHAKVAIKR